MTSLASSPSRHSSSAWQSSGWDGAEGWNVWNREVAARPTPDRAAANRPYLGVTSSAIASV